MNHLIKLILFYALSSQLFALGAPITPNVLFIAVDDMNDWIGCLETTPRAITPNIDKLASQGLNFTNAHTAGVYCAPSRAAIFTGRHATTTGCYQTSIYFYDHPEIRPLQVSFHEGGYKTMGAGKLFHHPAGAVDLRGWDEFFVRNTIQRETGYPLDSWSHGVPLPDPIPNSIYNRTGEPAPASFMEWAPLPNEREEDMADTIRANWAVSKLRETHDKPFFLGVGFYAPHFPNYCPQKYFDLYDSKNIEFPPYKSDDLDDLPEKIRKIKTNRSRIHKRLESIEAIDDAIHGYLACMSYADAMIGRVLDALEGSPYADNTIVVLWSDHGYHHGEKGDWGKHTLWERTSNVPFIWRGPGVVKGQKTDTTVSLIDMYPTFVEMCNLQPVEGLEGVSIADTLKNPSSAKDRNVLLPWMDPGSYAIINRDYRYIHYSEGGEELYAVQADPNEWYNLANDPQFADIKATLKNAAPKTFAKPGTKLNTRRNLVITVFLFGTMIDDHLEWDARIML
jgi:arylsulfatase A-like enzyme